MRLTATDAIEGFKASEIRIYDEYPARWDKLLDRMREARSVDTFRMFIREVYSFNSKFRISPKELPGRVPSGMSIPHAALFTDRPIVWVRDFNPYELVLHLIRWGLIPRDELEEIFNSPEGSELLRGGVYSENILRRYLDPRGIEKAVEIATDTYRRAHRKLGVIIAATGTPDRYRDHPEVVAFLSRIARIQGGVPFGGIRNEFIARKLAGERYEEVFREGLKRFDGDYYAAFRYAKMLALSELFPFRKSVGTILSSVSGDRTAIKEAYMTVYSSVYGSLLGVHPILGGRELHPDEASSPDIHPAGVEASTFGPAGIFMKKRLELPAMDIEDVIQYGRPIRNVYKRLYLAEKNSLLDFGEVLPEITDELMEEVNDLKAKIDVPGILSDSLSAVNLAFQFFSHSNVGMFDIVTAVLPALYTVFVYYRLLKTKRRINELLERLLDYPVSTSVNCLIVNPHHQREVAGP